MVPMNRSNEYFLQTTAPNSNEIITILPGADLYNSEEAAFGYLVKKNINSELPYFFVTYKENAQGRETRLFADAALFIETYYCSNSKYYFEVYKVSPKTKSLKFFCDSKVIEANQTHHIKYIQACHSKPTSWRGAVRFDMANYYEEKSESATKHAPEYYLQKAKKLIDLAIEEDNDKYARLQRVEWLKNGGNPLIAQSEEQASIEMGTLVHQLNMNDPNSLTYVEYYLELLENLGVQNTHAEVRFCNALLGNSHPPASPATK